MSGADQSWSEQRHKATLATQQQEGESKSYKSVQKWGSYDYAGMNMTQRREYVADMLLRVREELGSGNPTMALSTASVVLSSIVNYGGLQSGSNNNGAAWAQNLDGGANSTATLTSAGGGVGANSSGGGVNVIQFLRLLLLQAECYSRLKNHAKAADAAMEAIRRGGYNSAQAHFIAAREMFFLSEIEKSVDLFVRAESLLESRVPEHEDTNTSEEAWAAVGIDPLVAPKGSNPRDYFKEDYAFAVPNTAITKDDNGISIVTSPSGFNHSTSTIGTGTAGGGGIGGNYHPSVYEWAGELPMYRSYKTQAETLFKLLQSRCIPNSLESTNAVARYVRRHMATAVQANPSSPTTAMSSAGFGGPSTGHQRRASEATLAPPGGLCVIVKNFTEANIAMFCSTLEQGSEWDTLFRPPNAIPPNHLGACVVRQNKANKNGPLNGILGLKVEDSTNILLRFGAPNVSTISQVVGVGATTSTNFVPPAINNPSCAEGGVFVAQASSVGTENAVWKLSAQGVIDSSTSVLTCPSVPAHWFAQREAIARDPNASQTFIDGDSGDKQGLIANCRSQKHKIVFGPVAYLCSPQNNGRVFQICAQRPHLATPNVLIFTVQEHRDPCDRLNELDLTSVFEFLHPDHRYKVACVNRSCRSLLAALPPTSSYYDTSIVNDSVMVDTSLSPSETVGPIHRSLYPSYALHRDYFDNPFIVRDKGAVTFDFGVEKPNGSSNSSASQHLLAFDPASDTLLFHYLISTGTVTTERYLFYGPRRRTLMLQMSENTIWGLFSKKAAHVYVAGGPYASAGGSNRMTIGRIEPGPENSFNFVAVYDKPELSTDPLLLRTGREKMDNAVAPATSKTLYRIQRRMVPGTKIVEQIVVTRGPDFPTDLLPPHMQRQRQLQQAINKNTGNGSGNGLGGRYGNSAPPSASSSISSTPSTKGFSKDKPLPTANAFFAGPQSFLNNAKGISYDRCKRQPTAAINNTAGGGGGSGHTSAANSASTSPSKQPQHATAQGLASESTSTQLLADTSSNYLQAPQNRPPASSGGASSSAKSVEHHDFVAKYIRPASMGTYSKQHTNSANTSRLGDFVVAEGSDALLSFLLVAYAFEQWTA